MLNAWRASVAISVFFAALMTGSGTARADDTADAKKAVENFVAAWQTGDARAMKATLSILPDREKDLDTILASVAAVSRLQKAAVDKFGAAANEHFSDGKEQFAARMKKVQEGPIKMVGESAILTIAPDQATRTHGGTLAIVKRDGTWKVDGGSLFKITPALVAFSAKLTTVADQVAREIAQNKYAAAVDAYHEFNTRYAAAVKELEAPATQAEKPVNP